VDRQRCHTGGETRSKKMRKIPVGLEYSVGGKDCLLNGRRCANRGVGGEGPASCAERWKSERAWVKAGKRNPITKSRKKKDLKKNNQTERWVEGEEKRGAVFGGKSKKIQPGDTE